MKKSNFFNVKMIKKFLCLFSIITVMFLSINYTFCYPTTINAYVAANVYSQPANSYFDDDNFYQCVVDAYNKKNSTNVAYTAVLTDEQLQTITSLYCESEEIANTTGLEKLTELVTLNLSDNLLTEIDLSNSIKIESFNAEKNNLSSLNFGEITSLKYLYLENNVLTEIDLSNFEDLIHFRADNNNLQNLNLSNNTNLTYLSIDNNKLSDLNIENLSNLQTLYAGYNLINQIDFENNNSLKDVRIDNNNIENLELQNKPNLSYLDADNNKLKNVKIINNSALSSISLNNNKITNLIVENNDSLSKLYVNQNNLQYLDLSNNTNLKIIQAYLNDLTNINVDNLEKLETLIVWNNNLQSINLEDNVNLASLLISYNELDSVNLVNNIKLTDINLNGNSFNTIILSDKNYQLALTSIIDSKDYVTKLDIGNNKIIQPSEEIKLYINNKIVIPSNYYVEDFINKLQLQNLNASVYDGENNVITNDIIKNGYYLKIYNGEEVLQNVLIETFENQYFDDYNFYKCVVDGYNLSNTPTKNYEDVLDIEEIKKIKKIRCETDYKIMSVKGIELLENLNYLYLPDNNISQIDLSNNPKLEFLNLQKNNLSSINLSNLVNLTDIWLDSNLLTELDLSDNIALKNLSLPYNDLIQLDVSQNLNLEIIDIVGNELTELDLSNNSKLISVDINNNYQSNLIIYKDDLIDLKKYSPVKFFEDKESIIQEIKINYNEIKHENNIITINKSGTYSFEIVFKPNVSGVAELYSVNYSVNVLEIESKQYFIKNDKIYIGTETDNNKIIDNIKVNGIIDGISTTIQDNKFVIKNNDENFKEFELLNVNINNLNVRQKNVILEKDITYEEFTNSITISDSLNYKIFNGANEINEGNISEGMCLKIYYDNEEIDSFDITVEYITIDESISVDKDNMYFKNVDLNTKVETIINKIDTTGEVTIKNKDNKVITGTNLIGTGSIVSIKLSKETYEYTVIIHGDVDGDGVLKLSDIMKIANYTYKNKNSLSGVFELAADFDNNGTHNLQDIMKSAKALYGGK